MNEQECLALMKAPGDNRANKYPNTRLTIITGDIIRNKWGRPSVMCKCDCGTEKLVEIRLLKLGLVKTCSEKGCGVGRKHGKSNSKVYLAWRAMKKRCNNQSSPQYKNYGGRGIDYDPRWEDFEVFLSEVGEPSTPELTIDRIDNSKGYWPGNVRWTTVKVQSNNKRTNTVLEFLGEERTLAGWAEQTGIKISTICERLRMGWSIERTLGTPTRGYRNG